MKKIILIGSVMAASVLPLAAFAADKQGPYVALNGQLGFIPDQTIDDVFLPTDIKYDPGYGVGAALGYDFAGSGLRLEGEITYRYNEATVSTPVFPGVEATGDVDSLAYMANVYYDIDTNSNITPYVGAGVGMVDIDGDDTVFAYQGMAGAAYSLNDRSEIYAGYRYFGSEGVKDEGIKVDYASHSAEVGYRIRF